MTVVPSNRLASSYAIPVSPNSGYHAEHVYSDPKPQEGPLSNMCFPSVNDPEYVAYNNTLKRKVVPISLQPMNPSSHFSSIATLLPLITSGNPSQHAGKILNDKTVSLLKPPQVKEHSNAIPIPTAPHHAPAPLERGSREKYNADLARDQALDEEISKTLFGPEASSLPTPAPTIKQETLTVFSWLVVGSTILTILLMDDVWQGSFWPTLVS
jgi:hypothetical protein